MHVVSSLGKKGMKTPRNVNQKGAVSKKTESALYK